MSELQTTPTPAATEAPPPSGVVVARRLEWATIAEEGGIRGWVDAELRRQGLLDDTTDTSRLSDKERKQYKARREEERRVRRELYRRAWTVYRSAHMVHLGAGVFYHDTVDVDRFDIDDPTGRRQANDLPELKNVGELATALNLSVSRLRWLVYHREVDSGTHYQRWLVPKRDGGQRLISAPKKDLKAAQRWVARRITEHLPVHGAAHGFLAGRSTRTNADLHAGAEVLVKFDVKDFYPTLTQPRVKGLLRKAGYNEQVATVLSMLCTEAPREQMLLRRKLYHVAIGPRSLPQGAPTSPSITNAICLRLDARMTGLARCLGFVYSRYADDLTFSWRPAETKKKKKKADGVKAPALGGLIKGVQRILRAEGFTVHPKKTRIMRSGGRQKVTGLVVNQAPEGRPPARVPRALIRRLRAAIFNRERGQSGHGETLAHLRGWAAYIHMADPSRAAPYIARLDRLAAQEQEGESTSPQGGNGHS